MFIQVIQGKITDPDGVRAELDRWEKELAPGATGWLGATSGVTKEGEYVAVVRFESEEAARRSSDRPEQGEWWNAMSKHFAGEVAFHDCAEVDVIGNGGSDDAGFVQIIQGKAKDPARLRQTMADFQKRPGGQRPDVIGGTVAWHGDGGFTQTMYFTSEKEAREGESKPKTPEMEAISAEWQRSIEGIRFLDLTEPRLVSA